MNHLIPPPETLPLAWGWLKTMLMIVFPLHLLFMNAMFGSTVMAIYARLKGDEASLSVARGVAGIIPCLVAFTVNLGVAALLFTQVLYGQFFYTSSILMAAFWLAVIPLLLAAYYLLYMHDFRFATMGKWGALAAGAAVLIFLSIALIYTNNMTLMLAPGVWRGYFGNSSGTLLNLSDPSLIPRYLHFIIGGTAIGGLFVAICGKFKGLWGAKAGEAATAVGMGTFTILTVAQMLDGLWFLQALPANVQQRFMGGEAAATILLFTGVLLALAVVMAGAMKRVYLAAGLAITLVYVMAFLRDQVRSAYLQPFVTPGALSVIPQYSPMLMFFAILAAGWSVVAWMLYKGAKSGS
jgi:hypothetical protein